MKYYYLNLHGHIDYFKVDKENLIVWRLRTTSGERSKRYHVKGIYEISYNSFHANYERFLAKFKHSDFYEIEKEDFDFEALNYIRNITK